MRFDLLNRTRLSRFLEIKGLLDRAKQRGKDLEVFWQLCAVNNQQITCVRNLIRKLCEEDVGAAQQGIEAYTGTQLLAWCEKCILHQEAAKMAKNKFADEKRVKKLELPDATNGCKNLMGHLKKTPGCNLSVISRGDGTLTSNRSEILAIFASTWQKIYTRLKDKPPCFDAFTEEFG